MDSSIQRVVARDYGLSHSKEVPLIKRIAKEIEKDKLNTFYKKNYASIKQEYKV